MSTDKEPCRQRDYCARFPFCGCGSPDPLPDRDTSKPAEAQGLFKKFHVTRTDGSDKEGGKHAGCEYFVLDIDHDPHARAALTAYAHSVERTHKALAWDMISRYNLKTPDEVAAPRVLPLTDEQIQDMARPFIRRVGSHWENENAISDDGKIEEFARAIEAAHGIQSPGISPKGDGEGGT